ncbi:MAG: thiaminase II, partial [Haemophilus parainfluenzae]|nr:thiaminase II [Haemophilus parainfluenzae]
MINQLIQQAQPYWKQYVEHEFVQQLAKGTLPKACFQHYLKQDYIYLFHYSRAFALGVFKARNFAEMDMPRKTLDTLCQEIQLHLDYCRQW